MRRRTYLSVAAAVAAGMAGCADGLDAGSDGDRTTAPAVDGDVAVGPGGDIELPVPEDELQRGAAKDAIPAITDPAFGEDWSGITVTARTQFGEEEIEPRLNDDDTVIGVTRDGEARAYPLRILNWHEVVNDIFEPRSKARRTASDGGLDGPLLVTYCPLCGSAMTAVRRVRGEETAFGVSGLLFMDDLVMYDETTESLWSQILATAINGEATGERLELVPSTLTTLAEWREAHPDTKVLLPPPESGTVGAGDGTRNYQRNPYAGYEDTDAVGISGRSAEDDRLHPKAEVIGVATEDAAKAYPTDRIVEAGIINDTVGDLPVVVTTTPDDSPVAYVREVGGETVSFSADGDRFIAAADSRWLRATGAAVDGPHEGERLTQANDISPLFWFSWVDFHPDTDLYGS
ncbi:DUF3179 domain-containing protein [Natronomonas sp.]|uniref:DUF3179 domain-containing protein n=1 Tax=Natronomonas sp. TaxID=2184060 RepID=UPI002FC3A596